MKDVLLTFISPIPKDEGRTTQQPLLVLHISKSELVLEVSVPQTTKCLRNWSPSIWAKLCWCQLLLLNSSEVKVVRRCAPMCATYVQFCKALSGIISRYPSWHLLSYLIGFLFLIHPIWTFLEAHQFGSEAIEVSHYSSFQNLQFGLPCSRMLIFVTLSVHSHLVRYQSLVNSTWIITFKVLCPFPFLYIFGNQLYLVHHWTLMPPQQFSAHGLWTLQISDQTTFCIALFTRHEL